MKKPTKVDIKAWTVLGLFFVVTFSVLAIVFGRIISFDLLVSLVFFIALMYFNKVFRERYIYPARHLLSDIEMMIDELLDDPRVSGATGERLKAMKVSIHEFLNPPAVDCDEYGRG